MTVFLSYASRDKPKIGKVLKELKSKGFVDPDDTITEASEVLVPGSSWRGEIRKAIEAASTVVVFWSAAGGKSDWVNYEIGMAEALGKSILVVAGKGEAPSVPRNLQDTQIIEIEDVR